MEPSPEPQAPVAAQERDCVARRWSRVQADGKEGGTEGDKQGGNAGDQAGGASMVVEQRASSPIIRRAAAFRIKYRKETACLPVMQVGFHPANRNGQPPSSDRCISLLKDILAIGFDPDEVHTGGVCVESLPGCRLFEEFNADSVEGNECWAAF